MSRTAHRLAALLLVLLLLTTAVACTGQTAPPPAAAEVLAAMQTAMAESAQVTPDGVVYTRAAAPSDPTYLTDTLLSALYGEAARGIAGSDDAGTGTASADGGEMAPPVNDAALFLSTAMHPCELAVFRCSDARGTATAVGLCRARLDVIRRAWAGTEWEDMTARALVTVEGSYVLLIVTEDPERTLDGARRVLG